jgi:hypothetical protein
MGKQKTCPRCGKTFECNHGSVCWCSSYSIDKENIELLKREFEDCLCEDCLRLYAKK